MRRRSRAGGEPVKTRRRKTVTPKRRNAPKSLGHSSSAASQESEIARLRRELKEALEQHTATSDVLKVVSQSGAQLGPVLDTLVAMATRICLAESGFIFRLHDGLCRMVASFGVPAEYRDFQERNPIAPGRGTLAGRTVLERRAVHIKDAAADSEYNRIEAVHLGHQRTMLGVPLVREDALIGVITLARSRVEFFTDKQIALVQNFAAQAVIAIENTRLLNELRESLEQQTATSEVLRVISSSPGELKPVFQTMLENAVRICEAKFGSLFRFDGEHFHFAAEVGTPLEYADFQRDRGPIKPRPGSQLERVMRTKQVCRTDDYAAETAPGYAATLGGARSTACAPMLKDDVLAGAIIIYRQEVRPFTDKQISLLTNFAAQAVIAIENTRLLNELRQSPEQQTATSEVLSVISSSPGELEPVFQAMLENATRICEAKFGTMYFREGDAFRAVAMHGAPPSYRASRLHALIRPGPNTALSRAVQTKDVVQIEDVTADRGYSERDPMRVAAVELGGVRTLLSVPMLKEQEVIGAIAIYREVVRPFADKQINLVRNFAAQAVIAIENTRLLNELRQSLEQQTATADVLRVISSSPGELEPVFQSMLENAVRICDAKFGNLALLEGDGFRFVAQHGAPEKYRLAREREPFIRGTTSLNRVITTKEIVHVADVAAEEPHSPIATLAGARDGAMVGLA